jgi:DNA-binding MarR family transcriptional regulator
MSLAIDVAEIRACAQHCAAANVRRASRAVTRLYGHIMAQTHLEPTQYSLLVACSLAKGLTLSKLADVLAMDRSALARNLAIMEKRDLVHVSAGGDRRTRKVALTEAGKIALADALPVWREAQNTVERKFGADRLRRLLSELRALTDAAQTKDP